ncbi:MAG: hypothetical protein U5R31_17365 [Acidimicrobiia bacterium]|nr:hypothetical protein [Acidimicrobiia bacterium]
MASADTAVGWRPDAADRRGALLRWKQRHLLGVGARDLFDLSDPREVGADLTAIAEASLEIALRSLEPRVPFTVVALGRFGGAEPPTAATSTWCSCTTETVPRTSRRPTGSPVPSCGS